MVIIQRAPGSVISLPLSDCDLSDLRPPLLCFLLEYVTFLTVTPNLTSIYIINRRPLFTHLGELARPRSLRAQPRGVLPSDATCKFEGPSNALSWGIHQVDPQNSESC